MPEWNMVANTRVDPARHDYPHTAPYVCVCAYVHIAFVAPHPNVFTHLVLDPG